MTSQVHRCDHCGAPAIVHVMHEVGRPGSAHHLCMQCSDRSANSRDPARTWLHRGPVLVAAGFVMLILTIMVGHFTPGATSTLDLRQIVLLATAALVVGCGSVTRTSSFSALGMTLLISVLIDGHLGLQGRANLGIPPVTGQVVACLTIGTGIALGFFSRRALGDRSQVGLARTDGRLR